jgi:hypothetical protein
MLKYLGNLLITAVSAGIVFGVYYVMGGMQPPKLDSFAYGIAFLALYESVKLNKYFG